MSVEKLLKEYAAGRRDFASVNLANANLFSSDLIGVNFTKADLRRTNLVFAYLNKVTFNQANLTGAKLGGQLSINQS